MLNNVFKLKNNIISYFKLFMMPFNPLKMIWFCYNMHFP